MTAADLLLPEGAAARPALPQDAGEVLRLTREAFAPYDGRLDPPTSALTESEDVVRADLALGGVVLELGGRPVAALRSRRSEGLLWVRRVVVDPALQRRGIGRALMRWTAASARDQGVEELRLGVRRVLPQNQAFYAALGYRPGGEHGAWLELCRPAPCLAVADDPEAMRALGRRIGALARPGDLVVLAGPLGAGKTVLVQGLAAGLGVRGSVTSPSFVLARVHRPEQEGGVPLVHADTWRLTGAGDPRADVDALDLDADLDTSVLAVEWGSGLVERLAEEHLLVEIDRPPGGPRVVCLTAYGAGWAERVRRLEPAPGRAGGAHLRG